MASIHLFSGTIFARTHLRPAQTILLLREVCCQHLKSEPSATIAREIKVAQKTVHNLRQTLQTNAKRLQLNTPLMTAVGLCSIL